LFFQPHFLDPELDPSADLSTLIWRLCDCLCIRFCPPRKKLLLHFSPPVLMFLTVIPSVVRGRASLSTQWIISFFFLPVGHALPPLSFSFIDPPTRSRDVPRRRHFFSPLNRYCIFAFPFFLLFTLPDPRSLQKGRTSSPATR